MLKKHLHKNINRQVGIYEMPQTTVYPNHLRNIYVGGKLIEKYQPDSRVIHMLPNNQYLCTCGNIQKGRDTFHTHKKTLIHLIRTRQIDDTHPSKSIQVQKGELLCSGVEVW